MQGSFVQNPIFTSQISEPKSSSDAFRKESVSLKIVLLKNSEWRIEESKGKELTILPSLKFASILSFAAKALALSSPISKLINFSTLTEITSMEELVELIKSAANYPKIIAQMEGETLEEKKVGKEGKHLQLFG